MTAPPLLTGSARTASRTCGAANCQPELTGVLRISREWTRHRRQGKARRGFCALVAGGVTALEEFGKSGLGRFDNSRGEPCGDVETGRIRTRPHTARARCSRSNAGPNPGPHHRGGCDLARVAGGCDRRELDHLGDLPGRVGHRARHCPRKRAALRAHWLDVAIVVLTIPLLGKVFAWFRLARFFRLLRFGVIVSRALQAERRLRRETRFVSPRS